jgi:hypothetical protein
MRLAFSISLWLIWVGVTIWGCFRNGFTWPDFSVAVFTLAVAIVSLRWVLQAHGEVAKKRAKNDCARDHRSIEAIENGLWCTAMCRCDKCDIDNKSLPDCSESPWNGDAISWASEWASKAQADGWALASDGFNLLCPNCYRTRSNLQNTFSRIAARDETHDLAD